MPSIFRDRVWMNVASAPGTGAVTLGSALTSFQSANAGGVQDGETNTWVFIDGAAWEISSCVYTASGTSLARTLIASSSGSLISLSSATTCFIDASSRDIRSVGLSQTMMLGDGSDGDVTISGSVTLTQDMYYKNLTLSSGAALNTAGWRVYVSENFDASAAPVGAIFCNGVAGNAATGTNTPGTGGSYSITGSIVSQASSGLNGVAGGTGNGSTNFAVGQLIGNGGDSGVAGSGGAGSGTTGGAGGGAGTSTPYKVPIGHINTPLLPLQADRTYLTPTRPGVMGPGGGSGGGDTVNRGGASGGSGSTPGVVVIMARTIIRGGSTAAGCIQAKGGAAGAGFAPTTGNCGGAGGSSGGPGGWVLIGYFYLSGSTASNAIDVTGGNGAAGTNGVGTGVGGDGGSGGGGGIVILANLLTGAVTRTTKVAPVAGSAHSGITGGAGGVATTTRVSL